VCYFLLKKILNQKKAAKGDFKKHTVFLGELLHGIVISFADGISEPEPLFFAIGSISSPCNSLRINLVQLRLGR